MIIRDDSYRLFPPDISPISSSTYWLLHHGLYTALGKYTVLKHTHGYLTSDANTVSCILPVRTMMR